MSAEYRAGRSWRIARVVICIMSAGFIFPSALMDVERERVAAMADWRNANG